MRLRIRHETKHRCECAETRLAQLVRVSPIESGTQRVLRWRVVDERGRTPRSFTDAFGNTTHLVSRRGGVCELSIVAEGEVEKIPGGTRAREEHDPRLFLRETPLTTSNDAIRHLARDARARGGGAPRAELLALLRQVCERVPHRIETNGTRAPIGGASGAGGGRDRAHAFLAAARSLGHPARCVSGYRYGAVDRATSGMHAWVEVWTEARGWFELDPSTGEPADSTLVRVAVGLDHDGAAPLRGVCSDGTSERLSVEPRVHDSSPVAASAAWQSQQ